MFDNYGALFIGGAVLLIIIVAIALVYASKMKRRGEMEHGNAMMLNEAVAMMYSHTVKVNLTRDTFVRKSAKTGTRRPEKEVSGYDDNSLALDRITIAEGYDRDDYSSTFSRTALMKAYTIGERKIKRRYRLISNDVIERYVMIEAFFLDDDDGDVVAMVLYKEEEEAVADQIEMRRALDLKNEELKRLMNEKATLTSMLEEKEEAVSQLEERVRDLNTEVEEIVVINAPQYDGPVKPVPGDVRTGIREVIPLIQSMTEGAGVSFSLKVEDICDHRVYIDDLYVNAMILDMMSNAVNGCEIGGRIFFVIKQIGTAFNGWAEFEYSCIYLGSSLSFTSEYVNALGGKAIIDRTEDGGNVLTVRVKFEVVEEAEDAADE